MNSKFVLNICYNADNSLDKFSPELCSFLEGRLTEINFSWMIIGSSKNFQGRAKSIWILSRSIQSYAKIIFYIVSRKYSAILFHSNPPLIFMCIFIIFCSFKKNTYLMLWGQEVSMDNSQTLKIVAVNIIKKLFLASIFRVVTFIDSDVKRAKNLAWPRLRGHEVLMSMYPSNIPKIFGKKSRQNTKIKFLCGISGNERNNHLDLIDIISKSVFNSTSVDLFFPISYGGSECYLKDVRARAEKKLQCKLHFLQNFLSPDDYRAFLNSMDFCALGNVAQQGFANMFQLLASGSTLFLNKKSDNFQFCKKHGLNVKTLEDLLNFADLAEIKFGKPVERFDKFTKNSLEAEWRSFFNRCFRYD